MILQVSPRLRRVPRLRRGIIILYIHAEFLIRLDTIVFLTAGEADSIHIESAVHIQGGAGNKPGVVGSKECCSRCYVFRLCHLP